jgi:hypothetical protein
MDLWEIGWGVMNWIHLAQDRDQWSTVVNTAMNLQISITCWKILEWLRNWQLL